MKFLILILLFVCCSQIEGQEKFFEIPKAKFIVLNSSKLRIEVKNLPGISAIRFDGNINEQIDRIQGGKIQRKLTLNAPRNVWSLNLDVKVRNKDIVNYFLTIKNSNVEKRFYASHVIKEPKSEAPKIPPIKSLCENCQLETSSLLVKDLKRNLMRKEQELQAFAVTKNVLEKLTNGRLSPDNQLKLCGIENENLNQIKEIIDRLVLQDLVLSKTFLPITNVKRINRNTASFEVSERWKKIVIVEMAKQKLISSKYKIQDLIRF